MSMGGPRPRTPVFSLLAAGILLTHAASAQPVMNSLRAERDIAPETNPLSAFWRVAPRVLAQFDARGKPVGRRATEIRSRWTAGYVYFLFICPYDELYLNPHPVTSAETNQLWKRDVAEVFLGSDFSDIRRYREFEISPLGEWMDLDIDLHKTHHEDGWVWNSGFQVAARIDRAAKIWYGAMRIPFPAIAPSPPAPGMEFRMNLFRSEGPPGRWQSIAWQPPLSDTFHTPERFGLLRLLDDPGASAIAAARSYYLDDLIRPHHYAPAKNSFLIAHLRKGERRTVLELKGSGAVRHIWSTWSVPGSDSDDAPPGRVRLRAYVDGADAPAIDAPIDELCRAAEATGASYVPWPAFVFRGAYNLYLPIWFSRGVRVEIEALEDLEEFYTQIDYRLSPLEVNNARLVSERRDGRLTLNYSGPNVTRLAATPERPMHFGISQGNELLLKGPGILRLLGFRGLPPGAQLRIYWDGESTPSVDAPIDYFFADFVNAAMDSSADQRTCYFPMPFRRSARVVLQFHAGAAAVEGIEYAFEPGTIASDTLYFHARYNAAPEDTIRLCSVPCTPGPRTGPFRRSEPLRYGPQPWRWRFRAHRRGHGGTESAARHLRRRLLLICMAPHRSDDAAYRRPAHARRYRLHLENPYPFRESLQFLFGVFAGMRPKSVAFWYQQAGNGTRGRVGRSRCSVEGAGSAGAKRHRKRCRSIARLRDNCADQGPCDAARDLAGCPHDQRLSRSDLSVPALCFYIQRDRVRCRRRLYQAHHPHLFSSGAHHRGAVRP